MRAWWVSAAALAAVQVPPALGQAPPALGQAPPALGQAPPALGQARCVVADPTGTPLNVRAEPNGPIVGALHNRANVRRLETVVDGRGRPWSLVVPLEGGRTGWVFREFVSCP